MRKTPLTEKKFDLEIEAIRALIETSAKPFPDDKKAQKERIDRGSKDMEFFGKTYFPHYVTAPCSALHRYFCERYPGMIFKSIETGIGDKEADAAPRGNAKSTWASFILYLWCCAFKYRFFILIISDTNSQAEDFVQCIKAELEVNERLEQDFPELTGRGRIWRSDRIITRNGIKIVGVGADQPFRGMRHGSKRPDLVGGDDIENDEAVESPDQRKKLEKKMFKKVLKIGQKNTVYFFIGTILHYDSFLSNLLNKPGWKGKKFKAVIHYSDSKLWERWEEIFVNISIGKEEAEAAADAFFDVHKEEMLKGIEVLWPEVEDYYYLMKMRISDGPAYFESEKQNEPINPEDAVFLEEWITYWDDENPDLAGIAHYGTVDPSLGKSSKISDPSVITGGRAKKLGEGLIIYLDIGDVEKRLPDKIIDDILTYHQRDPFHAFGVESTQFQEFFRTTLEKESHKKNLTLSTVELQVHKDKDLRIITLQPWIKNGWIRFRKNMRELVRHFIYYRPKGKGGRDDGPDAVEQLKSMIEKNVGPIEFKSTGKRVGSEMGSYMPAGEAVNY